ncbi:MAG: lipoprotein-releasing system permease protein [Clostridiales bacterium]|jgi:lipoprotein-releasing system permease protein|nr:lipoprotein-releasing system permease protein [Clostridiales bacterium]
MNFELKVALRFLKDGRGQTVFILLGIAVGVAVQVFINTLIAGLQIDLVNQTVGKSPHVWMVGQSSYEAALAANEDANYFRGNFEALTSPLKNWENIETILGSRTDLTAIVPVAEGSAFLIRTEETVPVVIKGMDIADADGIYGISESIVSGTASPGGDQILIGSGIASDYNLEIGDIVTLTIPGIRNQNYTIGGIFSLGSVTDDTWVVMRLSQAQKFLGLGSDVSKIEMQVADVYSAETIGGELQARFSGASVNNWIENNTSLLAALNSQSMSSLIIQIFVLFSITLGIASVLAVSVVQKSKQIGILKAMGTKDRQVSRIFLFQGAMMGVLGALAGGGMGVGMVRMFLWGTSLETGTPLFPLTIEWVRIVVILSIVVASSTLAAVIPARRSLKLNPVEVIRNG